MSIRLTAKQYAVVEAPANQKIFLQGMAGSGKTTIGARRIRHLLAAGVPGSEMLILVPHKRLSQPYLKELEGQNVTVSSFASLAFNMVEQFWSLIAEQINPDTAGEKPIFLNHEMAQYVMSKVVGTEIDQHDYFSSLRINRTRLYTEILDNLSKASTVGFPASQIAERMKAASRPNPEQLHLYDDAQACADLFRRFCLQHNLLDFSLQVSFFLDFLWKLDAPRRALTDRFRHIVADNIEEESPAAHRLLLDWLPDARSALLIYDTNAGYRTILGADEINALTLQGVCDKIVTLNDSRVMSPAVTLLEQELSGSILETSDAPAKHGRKRKADLRAAITYTAPEQQRYHTQMLDWTAESAASLIHGHGVKPSEIVVLAPLLSDSLRYALVSRLEARDIATYSLRPSRPLHDEPAARALLTLAKLAHPQWAFSPVYAIRKADIAAALVSVMDGLDLTRASLLVDILFKSGRLHPFSKLQNETLRARITGDFGACYDRLLAWLEAYQASKPLPIDSFFSKLAGEMLSQPGFRFHHGYDEARIVNSLIDSARNFRETTARFAPELDSGYEYLKMIDDGVLTNQYPPVEIDEQPNAVLVAPAYTFLLGNRPVDYQFWVSVDHPAWGRRPLQPLSNPYILSKQWPPGRVWTDADEQAVSQQILNRAITGLLRRCRKQIYFGYSQFNESGYEQIGELRLAVDDVLRRHANAETSGMAHG